MKKELVLSLVLVIALLFAGLLFIKIEQPVVEERIVYKEEAILKNRNFSIPPGATLIYGVAGAGSIPQNISFVSAKGAGCVWLYAENSTPLSCIKADGTDDTASNITLEDSTLFFFKPWMLALNDSFKWNAEGCFVINNELVCDLHLSITVIRVDYIGGVKYYVVKYSFGSFEVYQWIEDDRRILTREVGQDYEIILVE